MCIASRKNFDSYSRSSNADKIKNNMSTQDMKKLEKRMNKECGNGMCVKKTETKARKKKKPTQTIIDLYPVNCKNAN